MKQELHQSYNLLASWAEIVDKSEDPRVHSVLIRSTVVLFKLNFTYTGATTSQHTATVPFLLHQQKQVLIVSSNSTTWNVTTGPLEKTFKQTQRSELKQEEMTES